MSKINGVQIKSLKKFKGHEGEPVFQGNVYLNNKLLGFWSQSSCGAICDDFSFDEKLLSSAVEKMKNIQSDNNFYNASSFMSDLITLIDYEKYYKKMMRKYNTKDLIMVVLTDGYHESYIFSTEKKYFAMSDEDIIKIFSPMFDEDRKSFFKDAKEKLYLFTKLQDFNVNL